MYWRPQSLSFPASVYHSIHWSFPVLDMDIIITVQLLVEKIMLIFKHSTNTVTKSGYTLWIVAYTYNGQDRNSIINDDLKVTDLEVYKVELSMFIRITILTKVQPMIHWIISTRLFFYCFISVTDSSIIRCKNI